VQALAGHEPDALLPDLSDTSAFVHAFQSLTKPATTPS
jgi:hypothetical protein